MRLIDLEVFKTRTEHKRAGKLKSTGRISLIYDALGEYNEHGSGLADDDPLKLSLLLDVYKECKRWIEAKGREKSKSSTSNRMVHVRDLRGEAAHEAFALLQRAGLDQAMQHYQQRKTGQEAVGLEMGGFYAAERQSYLASGKRHAASATLLGGTHTGLASGNLGLGPLQKLKNRDLAQLLNSAKGKGRGDLTGQELAALEQLAGGSKGVVYLRKFERLKYLALPHNGNYYTPDLSAQFDTGGTKQYAMDLYGNLFVGEVGGKQGSLLHRHLRGTRKSEMANHSTFLGGKAVICAGDCQIVNGDIRRISNNSGHYKPGIAHLVRAVLMIHDQQIDISQLEVRFFDHANKRWAGEPGEEGNIAAGMWIIPIKLYSAQTIAAQTTVDNQNNVTNLPPQTGEEAIPETE